ncbi:endonuclease domain-containing protein [Microbacterium sp. A93]|uniref:endonuclease domain-containing protein n=1 Tax=Microbacterium sp. A93 TaxID=3450716 RepID=UPI003F4351F1
MSHRKSLPEPLLRLPFTLAEARRLGVSRDRFLAADIVRLGWGLYAAAGTDLGWPSGHEPPPHGLGQLALAALVKRFPGTVLSHATAAHVFKLPVPALVAADQTVHLTWFNVTRAVQRKGITAHRSPLAAQDRMGHLRLALTTPARVWLDLAPVLTASELVVLGDAVVNRPYRGGQRLDGWETLDGLSATLERAGSVKGVRTARLALARCRVGADSPPETLTRLALVDAGLPEPVTQLKGDPADRYSPAADLGYRQVKIAIQYDGKHHRTKAQQPSDARRDVWFQERGWMVVRLTAEDLDNGFTRLIGIVRRRLAAASSSIAATSSDIS